MLCNLVRAVDIDRELVDAVQIEQADAVPLQTPGGLLRARDGARDAILDLAQLVDEEIGGRAAADTDHGAVHHVPDRLARNRLFEIVLGHGRFGGGRSVQTPS